MNNGEGDQKGQPKNGNGKPPRRKWKSNKQWGEMKDKVPMKCLLCDGSHRMQNCLERARLATINKKDTEPESEL